ncbi:peptidylprolyl isomerase [Aliiruegeria lutimaris]|uniref:Peptidyl-prolyl cis-trans isomerase D n=1 Tax=Aliiruegeria lutimaris TaxID=571298 RepID=A0A1G8ZGN9_9RHOB|nr:peptidylprolyl isomerase [Aliiruegeria lutimaris]SDK13565.1 peptidyl-prolyl cis-trans isomerase D [Aliiruegeria lutimaris]
MKQKKKSASDYMMMVLMGMLILGLGGFGITNFSGGGTTIASVGDRDITAEDYYRAMVQAIRTQEASGATDLTLGAMEAQGIPAQVRGQLIGTEAINNEADGLGLSVGDAEVVRMITESPAFQGVDGKFDRESYEFMLDQNGWNVSDFEQDVREESTRNILQSSVVVGVAPPAQLTDILTEWFGQRRSFRWAEFGRDSLTTEIGEPTEEDLVAFHEENAPLFTLPETKAITFAWLTPDMLLDQVEIDEEALRALYAERADEYVIPERRLVERLVFGTPEEASAAKAAIESGEKDFAAVVEERGLTLEDVDIGDVAEDDLGQAGAAVFGRDEPGLVGPYPTDFGPALFRMNGILQARETSFEQALPELRAELGRERARRLIEDMITDMDDRLAGGATVEDLATETAMELGSIDYFPGSQDGIAAYEGFREAATALTEKDFPEILSLDDGSIYAMRLDAVKPPSLQPLEDVRDAVIAGWTAEAERAALVAEAEAAKAEMEAGKTLVDVAGLGVQSAENVTRSGFIDGLDPAVSEAVFGMESEEVAVVKTVNGAVLIVLDGIAEADLEDPQVALFNRAMQQQAAQGLSSDLFNYYAQYLTATAGISINDAGVNAVHSQVFR